MAFPQMYVNTKNGYVEAAELARVLSVFIEVIEAHRETADARFAQVSALQAECARLTAENARLRSDVDFLMRVSRAAGARAGR